MLLLRLSARQHCWCWPWSPVWGSICEFSPLWSCSLFPPSHTLLSGRKSPGTARTQESYAHSPWGQVGYINYLEFCTGDLPIFLHLFTYPTVYVTVDSMPLYFIALIRKNPIHGQFLTLVLQDAPGSSSVLPTVVLGSVIPPRSPGSFYWRMVLETKVWVLRTLTASDCYFFET